VGCIPVLPTRPTFHTCGTHNEPGYSCLCFRTSCWANSSSWRRLLRDFKPNPFPFKDRYWRSCLPPGMLKKPSSHL
jgi:hypothetical protein